MIRRLAGRPIFSCRRTSCF